MGLLHSQELSLAIATMTHLHQQKNNKLTKLTK